MEEKIKSIVCKWHQIFKLGKKKRKYTNVQFIIHWQLLFLLRAGKLGRHLTNGLTFWCVWGGAQVIWVRAHSAPPERWMRAKASPERASCCWTKFTATLCLGVAWPSPGDRTQPSVALSSCVPAEVTRSGISACAGELAKTFTSRWQEWFERRIYPRGRWINLQAGRREKARCDCWQIAENLWPMYLVI